MRSPRAPYTIWWRCSGRLPSNAALTTVASKCTLSSERTATTASGRPARISASIWTGFMAGPSIKRRKCKLSAMQTLSATRQEPRSESALIAAGRRALEIEARALAALPARIDAAFARACGLCLTATDAPATGRVVVSGLGKSGHIARKIAATLSSTGTSALFLHAAEAIHGDLGMVVRGDVLLAVSRSGDSAELLALLPHLTRLAVPVIALTGNAGSPLARAAAVHLDASVAAEACPLNLAPTASTTAAMAMGDALASALLAARGFTSDDFARSHP